jgi:hypothetical protein
MSNNLSDDEEALMLPDDISKIKPGMFVSGW